MRYIKALIKTIKQMDRIDRNMFLGSFCVTFGLVLTIPCEIFESYAVQIPTIVFIMMGFFLILKTFWEVDLRDDFKKFINKVKNNLD